MQSIEKVVILHDYMIINQSLIPKQEAYLYSI